MCIKIFIITYRSYLIYWVRSTARSINNNYLRHECEEQISILDQWKRIRGEEVLRLFYACIIIENGKGPRLLKVCHKQ